MVTPRDNLETLEQEFSRLGIPTEIPGFYDHPRFLEQEKKQKDFLELYASFVQKRHYEPEYLAYSKGVITKSAQILYEELVRDGRLGACLDASMVLSRILEREGVWNYITKGALTIEFALDSGLPKQFFYPYDHGEYQVPHAWLVAPPFLFVDVAIQRQPYQYDVSDYLPEMVLAEEADLYQASDEDLYSPSATAYLMSKGASRHKLISNVHPWLPQFWETFPARELEVRGSCIKYTPIGISAPDLPFEKSTSLVLSGRIGIQIYNDLIKPNL